MKSALLLALLAAAPAEDVVDDRDAILATIEDFFEALAARDVDGVLIEVAPEGTITAHNVRNGGAQVRTRPWAEWASELPNRPEPPREALIDPRIDVRGSLASVWSYYTFYRGNRFSHCGYDNFDLAKIDGRWVIVNLSFTVETEGCARR